MSDQAADPTWPELLAEVAVVKAQAAPERDAVTSVFKEYIGKLARTRENTTGGVAFTLVDFAASIAIGLFGSLLARNARVFALELMSSVCRHAAKAIESGEELSSEDTMHMIRKCVMVPGDDDYQGDVQ